MQKRLEGKRGVSKRTGMMLDIYRYLNKEDLIGFSFSKCALGRRGLSRLSRVMLSKSIELQGVLEKEDYKVGKKMRKDFIGALKCYENKHAKQKRTILLCLSRFLNPDLVRLVAEEYI